MALWLKICARGVFALPRCFEITRGFTPSGAKCKAAVAPEGPAPIMRTGKSMEITMKMNSARSSKSLGLLSRNYLKVIMCYQDVSCRRQFFDPVVQAMVHVESGVCPTITFGLLSVKWRKRGVGLQM